MGRIINSKAAPIPGTAFEQHFAPAELAKLWGLSAKFVRDLFRNDAGILSIDRPETMHKRGYLTMRIPASVAARVYAQLQTPCNRRNLMKVAA
jgi:hypothetical protein